MTRSGAVTLEWADGTHVFALKWGQIIELQEKLDAGPFFVLSRLMDGGWRAEDISETIRLGLIGGGMEPIKALNMVRNYVHERPLIENVGLAQAVLASAVMGAPEDKPGKSGAGKKTNANRSRAGKSGSPMSSEPAPPAA